MTTQLSARTVTQKLMDNEMKRSYSNTKIQKKNKTGANRCLTNNTLLHSHPLTWVQNTNCNYETHKLI